MSSSGGVFLKMKKMISFFTALLFAPGLLCAESFSYTDQSHYYFQSSLGTGAYSASGFNHKHVSSGIGGLGLGTALGYNFSNQWALEGGLIFFRGHCWQEHWLLVLAGQLVSK